MVAPPVTIVPTPTSAQSSPTAAPSDTPTLTPTATSTSSAQSPIPTPAPVAVRIAFVSNRDGDYEIHVTKVDGTGVTRLTGSLSADRDPRCGRTRTGAPTDRSVDCVESRDVQI